MTACGKQDLGDCIGTVQDISALCDRDSTRDTTYVHVIKVTIKYDNQLGTMLGRTAKLTS